MSEMICNIFGNLMDESISLNYLKKSKKIRHGTQNFSKECDKNTIILEIKWKTGIIEFSFIRISLLQYKRKIYGE